MTKGTTAGGTRYIMYGPFLQGRKRTVKIFVRDPRVDWQNTLRDLQHIDPRVNVSWFDRNHWIVPVHYTQDGKSEEGRMIYGRTPASAVNKALAFLKTTPYAWMVSTSAGDHLFSYNRKEKCFERVTKVKELCKTATYTTKPSNGQRTTASSTRKRSG